MTQPKKKAGNRRGTGPANRFSQLLNAELRAAVAYRRITLRDLEEAAGVSKARLSIALNQDAAPLNTNVGHCRLTQPIFAPARKPPARRKLQRQSLRRLRMLSWRRRFLPVLKRHRRIITPSPHTLQIRSSPTTVTGPHNDNQWTRRKG